MRVPNISVVNSAFTGVLKLQGKPRGGRSRQRVMNWWCEGYKGLCRPAAHLRCMCGGFVGNGTSGGASQPMAGSQVLRVIPPLSFHRNLQLEFTLLHAVC